MKKSRMGFLAAGLTAILLLCLLIPVMPDAHAYFDSPDAGGYTLLGTRGAEHLQPALVSHTAKHVLQPVPVRNPAEGYVDREMPSDFQITDRVGSLQPSDARREIRETIPHYFNGSKFKQTHLKI